MIIFHDDDDQHIDAYGRLQKRDGSVSENPEITTTKCEAISLFYIITIYDILLFYWPPAAKSYYSCC